MNYTYISFDENSWLILPKRLYCFDHKKETMIDVKNKKCIEDVLRQKNELDERIKEQIETSLREKKEIEQKHSEEQLKHQEAQN